MLYEQIASLNAISYNLERFKWQIPNRVANCRCDICGDSQTNKFKTRMYFYVEQDTLMVKCHNCGYCKPFTSYIFEHHKQEYDSYKLATFRFKAAPKKTEFEHDNSELKKLAVEHAKIKLGAKLSELPPNHAANIYFDDRKLPVSYKDYLYYTDTWADWFIERFGEQERKIPNDQRIIIPVYDASKNLIAVQGRAISHAQTLRYSTLKIVDNSDKIWGLERLNRTAPILAFEGVFDACFFANSVAMLGGDFNSLANVVPLSTYVVADNERRSKDTVARMNKAITAGFRVTFWPESVNGKDVNQMILNGHTAEEIYNIILNNSYSGSRAKAALAVWKKI